MESSLVLLLALSVTPGGDALPASAAFARGNPPVAMQSEPTDEVSWEVTDLPKGEPSRKKSEMAGFSSRRSHALRSASSLRLASTQAVDLATNGEGSHAAAAPLPDSVASAPIATAGCDCQACAAPGPHHHSVWGIVGLPSPHHAPGDMTQHIPYVAHPQSYYYLRPYNYFHIEEHQREVANYGGNPKEPYANRFFERVYDRTVDPFVNDTDVEPITPVQPLRRR